MNTTTLKGVFPEPQPIPKRNFVKENVTRIKQMQGVIQNPTGLPPKTRERKQLSIKKSIKSMTHSSKHGLQPHLNPLPKSARTPRKKVSTERPTKIDASASDGRIHNEKISHRAVQTDRPEDICSLYASGTIIYPSAKVLRNGMRQMVRKQHGFGDVEGIVVSNPHNEDMCDEMQDLDLSEKHDFIKENMLSLRSRTKSNSPPDQKGHPKGTLPKYLKERKEELKRSQTKEDPECPPGHVLLPDDERKETLRVLRQSYADRIKELNNMPVSNDTLKKRQRKMAIEEELKKIEEGIRVFQRPKVFVKINA